MRGTADSFAETTDLFPCDDVLSPMLDSMRITGTVLLAEEYAPPWSIAVPDAASLAAMVPNTDGARVVAFHLVLRGSVVLHLTASRSATAHAGEVFVCFGGMAHRVGEGSSPRIVGFRELITGGQNIFRPAATTHGESTALLCGVFLLRHTYLNPLYTALPPLVQATVTPEAADGGMSPTIALLMHELRFPQHGSTYLIERVVEVLCVSIIRAAMNAHAQETIGLFRGLRDPLIGRAIALIHTHPGAAWSVDMLGQEVNLSPSRFAARFRAVVGESPMRYVTRWRMHAASLLLSETNQGIEAISAATGYANMAAFSRTFKRYVGVSPGAWRARSRHE